MDWKDRIDLLSSGWTYEPRMTYALASHTWDDVVAHALVRAAFTLL
jgi:hypothetical protein